MKSATPILIKDTLDILFEFGDPKNPKYDPAYRYKSYSTTYSSDMKKSLETLIDKIIDDIKVEDIRTVVLDDRDVDSSRKGTRFPMLVGIGLVGLRI